MSNTDQTHQHEDPTTTTNEAWLSLLTFDAEAAGRQKSGLYKAGVTHLLVGLLGCPEPTGDGQVDGVHLRWAQEYGKTQVLLFGDPDVLDAGHPLNRLSKILGIPMSDFFQPNTADGALAKSLEWLAGQLLTKGILAANARGAKVPVEIIPHVRWSRPDDKGAKRKQKPHEARRLLRAGVNALAPACCTEEQLHTIGDALAEGERLDQIEANEVKANIAAKEEREAKRSAGDETRARVRATERAAHEAAAAGEPRPVRVVLDAEGFMSGYDLSPEELIEAQDVIDRHFAGQAGLRVDAAKIAAEITGRRPRTMTQAMGESIAKGAAPALEAGAAAVAGSVLEAGKKAAQYVGDRARQYTSGEGGEARTRSSRNSLRRGRGGRGGGSAPVVAGGSQREKNSAVMSMADEFVSMVRERLGLK